MSVSYDERLLAVRHVMHGRVYGNWLREGMNEGLALMAQHQSVRWLSDDRLNGPLSGEEMSWLRDDWEPRAVRSAGGSGLSSGRRGSSVR